MSIFRFTFVIKKTVQKFKNQVKNWKKEELQHVKTFTELCWELHDIIGDWPVLWDSTHRRESHEWAHSQWGFENYPFSFISELILLWFYHEPQDQQQWKESPLTHYRICSITFTTAVNSHSQQTHKPIDLVLRHGSLRIRHAL